MTVTPDTFTSDKITFSDPKKNSQEKYVSKIMYESGELLIQTPKMSCKIDKENRTLSLNVDDKSFYDFLGVFDEHIIQSLFASSKTWFNQELTEQQCKEIYKRSIESSFTMGSDSNMNIKVKNAHIYKKKNDKCEIEDLNTNEEVICLLRCSHLIFYRTYCVPYWDAIQIKIKDPKVSLNEYRIKDLEEDEISISITEDEIDSVPELNIIKD